MPDSPALQPLRLAVLLYLQRAYAAPMDLSLVCDMREAVATYAALLNLPLPVPATDDRDRDEAEFNRLFVGPGPLVAPPYESVYRSAEGLLQQESTQQVRALYRSYGLSRSPENGEPDDHLATELEFYAHLQAEAISAEQRGDYAAVPLLIQAQQDFLTEHLAQWVPEFCRLILAGSSNPYYNALAIITRELMARELHILAHLTPDAAPSAQGGIRL